MSLVRTKSKSVVVAAASLLLLLCVSGVAADCKSGTVSCLTPLQVCLPDLTGSTSEWSCVNWATALSCTPSCATGTTCFFGTCLSCSSSACGLADITSASDSLAHALLSMSVTSAFNGASSLSSSTIETIDSSLTLAKTAADGVLTTITSVAESFGVSTLTLGNTAIEQAAVLIDSGKNVQIAVLNAVSEQSALILRSGSFMNVSVYSIPSSLMQSAITFQANADALAEQAIAYIQTLDLQGSLIVSGPGHVIFPNSNETMIVSATAVIRAAGDVVLSGVLNTASLTIGGVTNSFASAKVAAGDTLTMYGNVITTSGSEAADALLKVYGNMIFGGTSTTVNTSIEVQGNTSTSTSGASGELHCRGDSMTHNGNIKVSGGSKVHIKKPSPAIKFGKFVECSEDSYIDIECPSEMFTSGTGSGVALSFDASTTDISSMMCDIRLIDSTGVHESVVCTNKNKGSSSSRRLLATDTSSTWNDDGTVTYNFGVTTVTASTSGASLNAGGAAVSGVAVAAAAAAAIVGGAHIEL